MENKSQNVLSQLTNAVLGDNWQTGTYEPTIGLAENGNEGVRVVSTGDAETAAQRFCDLVGLDAATFNAAADYTFTDERIGSLTWHPASGSALATVDADIKQMPTLSKILYKTPEQMGANSTFNGTAYYRFGDVVRKLNSDGTGYDYWVCVRPAFGTVEGKEESHWITLSPLPVQNTTTTGKGPHFQLPKGLSTKTEHLQNLAEIAYAMTHPDQWRQNLRNNGYKTLKYFHDFHYDQTYKYNDHLFFGNVDWAWKQTQVDGKDLYRTIFRLSAADFSKLLEDFGLRFVYGDASVSSNATVNFPTMEYSGTNLKTASKGRYSAYSPGQDYYITEKYTADTKFPSDMAYSLYLPRYATGADLCKGQVKAKYDVYSPLANCEDVYVYNKLFGIVNDKDGLKNVTPEILYTPTNGSGYYLPGDVVVDEEGSRWFCLLGSPFNAPVPGVHQDHNAYFFSLEGIKLSANGKTATNIISEEELNTFLFYYSDYLLMMSDVRGDFRYESSMRPGAGNLHLLKYAGVDLNKLFVVRDSVWRFYDQSHNKYYDSASKNRFYNVAYNNGSTDKQPIARMVIDVTQAGSHRASCPDGRYKDVHARAYKHYWEPDTMLAREPDAAERQMGLTRWHMPWAMGQYPMSLQDVADARYVTAMSWIDKWVTLPWHLDEDWDITGGERGKMRIVVENSADPADYLWDAEAQDFATHKTSMYNEPVLFIRMMKVNDMGRFPTLQSADGRVKFSILHHQNSEDGYSMGAGRIWTNTFMVARKELLEVDNQLVVIPDLEGSLLP